MDFIDQPWQLGPKSSEHRISVFSLLHALVIFGLLIALGSFWVFQGITRYGQVSDDSSGYDAVLVIGSGILLAVLFLATKMLLELRQRVILHREGFFSVRPSGTDVFRWDEISSVRHREASYDINFVPAGTFRTFIVRRIDGKEIELNNYLTGLASLGATVLQGTFNRMEKTCWTAFQSGHSVPFGLVVVTRAGIEVRGELLPWSQLREIHVAGDRLCIKSSRFWSWRELPMLKIENSHVLLALVQRIQLENNRCP